MFGFGLSQGYGGGLEITWQRTMKGLKMTIEKGINNFFVSPPPLKAITHSSDSEIRNHTPVHQGAGMYLQYMPTTTKKKQLPLIVVLTPR